MISVRNRTLVVVALSLVVGATYVVVCRSPTTQRTMTKQQPARIERRTGAEVRPLDHDFNAAMRRDSKAAPSR